MLNPEEIPTQGELLSWLDGVKGPRDKALFSLLYLTGARINEILNRFRKKQIEIVQVDNKSYIQFNDIYTEKNPRHPNRTVYAPIFYEYEQGFFKLVQNHIKNMNPNTIIFEMTSQRAWQIINKIIGEHKKKSKRIFLNGCHYLRHCRSTHLSKLYGLDAKNLQEWHQWSSTAPASTYIHLKLEDLLGKFAKRRA